MKKSISNPSQILLIEWSPAHVRVIDRSIGQTHSGTTLSEALGSTYSGRSAVIAISQRSAFIRSLSVPPASRAEMAKVLEFQLGQVVPLESSECVFGFRVGSELGDKGRLAIVAAVKADSIRRLYAEAKECGLHIYAVTPLAFGSWLAARAQNLANCAVVEMHQDALNVDIISGGELYYSRSIPGPDSLEEIDDEIARTFAISGVEPSPILSAGSPAIKAEFTDGRETIEYLADTAAIDKLLFSIDLPESKERRAAGAARVIAMRAIAMTAIALVLCAFAVMKSQVLKPGVPPPSKSDQKALGLAQAEQTADQSKLDKIDKSNRILDVAFKPGQTFSDMVSVLANSASPKSWFTALTVGRGIPIAINGMAMSDADVGKFVDQISKDPRFQEMKIVGTSKAVLGKMPVTDFVISGRAMGCLAFDKPPKTEKKK